MKKIQVTLKRIKNCLDDQEYKLVRLNNTVTVTDGTTQFRVGDGLTEKQVEKLNQDRHYTVTITE